MKGHVGDGARSGGLKAPMTGNLKPIATSYPITTVGSDDACPSYPLRLTVQVSAP